VVLKTFQLEWQGGKEDFSYEDDIPFGDMESIIKDCVDLSDVTKPKVNISKYRHRILTATLRKAPFTTTDPVAINKIPRKTVEKIITEVMKDYPLAGCLEGWMTSFLGSAQQINLSTIPTGSVLTNSDGISQPQTTNQQNGSKKQSPQQSNSSKTK